LERNLERFTSIARRALGTSAIRTIVEVGARDCRETLGFHALFPQAAVFAFECNPATLPQCREAVRGVANVTLIEKAVSDKSGPVGFFAIDQAQTKTGVADGNPGASSLLRASGNFELETYVQHEVAVTATTLAEFLAERKLAGIDLLWMDIQGAELMALQVLGAMLADLPAGAEPAAIRHATTMSAFIGASVSGRACVLPKSLAPRPPRVHSKAPQISRRSAGSGLL